MIILRQKEFGLKDNKKLGQAWYNTKSTAKGALIGAGLGAALVPGNGLAFASGNNKLGIGLTAAGATIGGILGGGVGYTSAPIYKTPAEKKHEGEVIQTIPSWVYEVIDKVIGLVSIEDSRLQKLSAHRECGNYLYFPNIDVENEVLKNDVVKISYTYGKHENVLIFDDSLSIFFINGKVYTGKFILRDNKLDENSLVEVKNKRELAREIKVKLYDTIKKDSLDNYSEYIFGESLRKLEDNDEIGLYTTTVKEFKEYVNEFFKSLENIKRGILSIN